MHVRILSSLASIKPSRFLLAVPMLVYPVLQWRSSSKDTHNQRDLHLCRNPIDGRPARATFRPRHPASVRGVSVTGIALLAFAACIATNKGARQAALLLGWTIVLFDLLTWVPVFTAHPMRLTGNWLKDLGIAGGAFILADSLAAKDVASY